MSDDPTLALQAMLVERLRGNTAAGQRVYDRVPANMATTYPRITIGPGQALADNADCIEGTESILQVDVWSRAVGFPEAKTIAGQVRDLLNGVEPSISGHRVVLLEFQNAQYLNDPDGLTLHVAMAYRALTEPIDLST